MVTSRLVRRPESRQSLNCVAGIQLIIDAGGEFGFPWGHCSTAFHLNPTYAYSALKGTSYSEVLKDCLQEHAVRLFSKDPEYPSVAQVFLLTDMVCGQFIEVQDLWRQIRPNLYAPVTDTTSLFNFMVADLVSTAEKVYSDGAVSTWLWVKVIDRVFVNCTNAGEIDQANRILTSLVARSSSFVKHLNISFSQQMGNPYHVPIDLLYGCNRETLDILEWNGISPDVVDYRLMQECLLDDRAFPEFLWRRISISTMFDWMLVCASDCVEFSEHVLPLLREGADVNYIGWDCPYFGEDFSVPRTPLGAAVRAGEKETVQLLLDYGADVLLDSEERSSLSGIATVGGYQELAEMLKKLEVKEQTKRNLSTVPGSYFQFCRPVSV